MSVYTLTATLHGGMGEGSKHVSAVYDNEETANAAHALLKRLEELAYEIMEELEEDEKNQRYKEEWTEIDKYGLRTVTDEMFVEEREIGDIVLTKVEIGKAVVN
jgi:hypothetical protein